MGIGPVEYGVIAFPGNKFKGEIAPALEELVKSGTIRILDLAFVLKDKDGNVTGFELEDAGSEVMKAFEALTHARDGLINDNDLKDIGAALDPNSSAAVLVWEDVWATKFADAVRKRRRGRRGHAARPVRAGPGSHRLQQGTRRRESLTGSLTDKQRSSTTMMRRRRGPGLVRMAAGTAVIAGTAGRSGTIRSRSTRIRPRSSRPSNRPSMTRAMRQRQRSRRTPLRRLQRLRGRT